MEDQVILVDQNGAEIGTAPKSVAHRDGALHRAFSIFVFDGNGRVLLQQRAHTKYHSKGLWSNTCCSHPRPHESLHESAHRRLREEMGFDCPLTEIFSFTYEVQLADDVVEHEYDHVFFGHYDGQLAPNPAEVNSWKWIDLAELRKDIIANPDRYTYWLRLCIDQVIAQHVEQSARGKAVGGKR